jgi:serpin B
MARLRFFALILLLLVDAALGADGWNVPSSSRERNADKQVPNTDLEVLVKAGNRFALDLYWTIAQEPGNIFLAPACIHSSLAMIAAAARGSTEQEILQALRIPAGWKGLHESWADLRNALCPKPLPPARVPDGDDGKTAGEAGSEERDAPYRLLLASALWGQKGLRFRNDFLDLLASRYEAGFQELDQGSPNVAQRTIDGWVEKVTGGKIRESVGAGGLRELPDAPGLVLTSSVYFRGRWHLEFEPSNTQDAPFFLTPEIKVSVPTMVMKTIIRYFESDLFKAVELPYRDEKVSMFIFLPRGVGGLPNLEKIFTPENFEVWLRSFKQREVDLRLPKFEMALRYTLDERLQKMGMVAPFQKGKADFSGLLKDHGQPPVYLGKVLHAAWVNVNERGTEAAAATTEVIVFYGAVEAATFQADHPFIFLIRHRMTGAILFMGRMSDPRKKGQ